MKLSSFRRAHVARPWRQSLTRGFGLLGTALAAGCSPDGETTGPGRAETLQPQPAFSTGQRLVATEIRATSSDATESTPTLGADPGAGTGNSIVVFTSSTDDNGTIYYQRLNSSGLIGGPVPVSDFESTNDRLNDTSGDLIVYTSYLDADRRIGEVKLHAISSGTTATVSQLTEIFEARVHGRRVVWVEGAAGSTRIMMRDDVFNPVRPPRSIAGPGTPGTGLAANDVEVGSRLVVWSERGDGEFNVRAYDLETGEYYDVANDPTVSESSPSTSGPWVVWQRGNEFTTIEAYNVDTGERRSFGRSGASNLAPTIDGELVGFESNAAGNYDIYLYRLSDGMTFQVTSEPHAQRLNNVFGGYIAYVDARHGNSDIFVTAFDFVDADQTAPVLTLPANITTVATSRDGATVIYTASATDDTDPEPDVVCAPASGSLFPLGSTDVTCTATDEAGNNAGGSFTVTVVETAARIEVIPGGPLLPIKLSGPLPLITVILKSTASVNASLVDPGTATLGNGVGADAPVARLNGHPLATLVDIDRDGHRDLVLVFKKADLQATGDLTTATTELVLRAELSDGRPIRGTDEVRVIP